MAARTRTPRGSSGARGTQAPVFDLDEVVVLADLAPGDADRFDAFVGVAYSGVARDTWDLAVGDTVEACRFDGLELGSWTLRGTHLLESVVAGANVPAVSGARSGWRDVEVRDSRFGSVEVYDTSWRGIRFTRCKLGYVNLRSAELLDVAFVDCTIDEIDLMDAAARRVSFDGCRIATLNASGAKLTDVDLRGADLGQVVGIEGLRGATISAEQLQLMAPAFAELLGLTVDG